MLIEKLTLSNYGIYGETTCIDLSNESSSDPDRPLTIIKGHNGAGKTTLLNAVRLALYGEHVNSEKRLSPKGYEKFLTEKIHFGTPHSKAYIELTFKNRIHGKDIFYTVNRSWRIRKGVFEYDEKFRQSNGEDGETVVLSKEDWDAIVSDLVPEGVSQFFFFDGEKIQEIADQKNSNGLDYAIRSLLGLNMIERLRKDILLYLQRNKNSEASEASEEVNLEKLSKDATAAQTLLDESRRRRADINQSLRNAERELGLAELRLFKEGGMSNDVRDALKLIEETLLAKQQELKADLVEILGNETVFQIAPNLLTDISKSANAQKSKAEANIISTFLDGLTGAEISPSTVMKLKSACDQRYSTSNKGENLKLSPTSLALIESIQAAHSFDGEKFGTDINHVEQDLSDARNRLLANEEAAASKAQERFLKAQRAESQAQSALRDIDLEINEQSKKNEFAQKQIEIYEENLLQEARSDRQMRMASQTIKVLEQYETEIMAKKLKEISKNFVLIFNKLSRKDNLITEVIIEPKTFEVTLKGNGKDGIVDSDRLSAGERQLYAISLLWALGKVSGKNIPLIIDTPFSRLDNETRHKIVEHYIPFAAQQVVILFTDSELTKDLEPKLAPITRSSIEINVASGNSANQVTERKSNAA